MNRAVQISLSYAHLISFGYTSNGNIEWVVRFVLVQFLELHIYYGY